MTAYSGLADVFKKMNDTPNLSTNRPSLKRHFRRNDSNYYSLSYPHHFSMVTKAIADVCEQNSISHMIVFGRFLAEFVRPFSSNKKILFDLCDREVLRLTREIHFFPPSPLQLKTRLKAHLMRARLAKAEACLPHWFNHVTTINDADSDIICRLSGISTNISTIPNGVSTDLAETFDANGHVAKRRGLFGEIFPLNRTATLFVSSTRMSIDRTWHRRELSGAWGAGMRNVGL
jgi:hypothetical protein